MTVTKSFTPKTEATPPAANTSSANRLPTAASALVTLNVAGRVVSKVNLVASGLGVGDGEAVATARSYGASAITTQVRRRRRSTACPGAGSPSASRSTAARRLQAGGQDLSTGDRDDAAHQAWDAKRRHARRLRPISATAARPRARPGREGVRSGGARAGPVVPQRHHHGVGDGRRVPAPCPRPSPGQRRGVSTRPAGRMAPPRAARYVAANARRPYFARVCAIGGWRRGHGTVATERVTGGPSRDCTHRPRPTGQRAGAVHPGEIALTSRHGATRARPFVVSRSGIVRQVRPIPAPRRFPRLGAGPRRLSHAALGDEMCPPSFVLARPGNGVGRRRRP